MQMEGIVLGDWIRTREADFGVYVGPGFCPRVYYHRRGASLIVHEEAELEDPGPEALSPLLPQHLHARHCYDFATAVAWMQREADGVLSSGTRGDTANDGLTIASPLHARTSLSTSFNTAYVLVLVVIIKGVQTS
jgi:hypothetical protein